MKELPNNYENCAPHNATHVWITGRGMLCKIHDTSDSTVCAEVPTGGAIQFAYPALHLLKLTTDFVYCRERPPFRVATVGTAKCVLQKLEPNGERSENWVIEVPGAGLEIGKTYRVTIEEVQPE